MNRENPTQAIGFLNVLKPPGMSSAQVVGMARRLLGGVKVGHAGTLDPEAAGVLPLMVGKAARLFDLLQDHDKAYVAELAFGCSTDTQDAQGAVLARGHRFPDEAALRAALAGFTGEISQTPPMYSAIKQQGKRLYELARSGQTVAVEPRRVTVHDLRLTALTENHGALISVRCSKGFYVRTLCQDLGEALGCPAHMRFLLRTQSGRFALETAQPLEQLEAYAKNGALSARLLPVEHVLGHLPWCEVPPKLEKAFQTGGKLPFAAFEGLMGTAAEQGAPACFRLQGRTLAVGGRQADEVKLNIWLGE